MSDDDPDCGHGYEHPAWCPKCREEARRIIDLRARGCVCTESGVRGFPSSCPVHRWQAMIDSVDAKGAGS